MEKYRSDQLDTSCKKEHNELRKLATSRTYIRRLPGYLVKTMCVGSDPGPISRVVRLRSLPVTREDRIDEFRRSADFGRLLHIARKYSSLLGYLKEAIINTACIYGNCEVMIGLAFRSNRKYIDDGQYLAFYYMHWDLLDLILPREPTMSIREAACISLPALSYYVSKFGSLPFDGPKMCNLISKYCYSYGIDRELLDFVGSLTTPYVSTEAGWLEIPWVVRIPTVMHRPKMVLEVLDYIIAHSPPGYWQSQSIGWILSNIPRGDYRNILEVRLTLEGCQP